MQICRLSLIGFLSLDFGPIASLSLLYVVLPRFVNRRLAENLLDAALFRRMPFPPAAVPATSPITGIATRGYSPAVWAANRIVRPGSSNISECSGSTRLEF